MQPGFIFRTRPACVCLFLQGNRKDPTITREEQRVSKATPGKERRAACGFSAGFYMAVWFVIYLTCTAHKMCKQRWAYYPACTRSAFFPLYWIHYAHLRSRVPYFSSCRVSDLLESIIVLHLQRGAEACEGNERMRIKFLKYFVIFYCIAAISLSLILWSNEHNSWMWIKFYISSWIISSLLIL
jgi:hypothetical protein